MYILCFVNVKRVARISEHAASEELLVAMKPGKLENSQALTSTIGKRPHDPRSKSEKDEVKIEFGSLIGLLALRSKYI